MPNPLTIGLALNPGFVDANAPAAAELQGLGATWVRFLLSKRLDSTDNIQNFETGQNAELDRLLARLPAAKVLALVNHETLGISPGEMRADWNATILRTAELAERIARFYGNRIAALEIFNEPDNFDPGTTQARFSAQDYGALLRETYRRVKAANAGLPVISGGLISPDTEYMRAMLGAAGILPDGVGWHGFLRPARGFPRPDWGEPVYGQDLEMSIRAARSAARRPIWITEIGTSLNEIGGETNAAEYIRRALPVCYELGAHIVSHVFWFTWKFPASAGEPGKDYGLVDGSGWRRPAWTAYSEETQRIAALPPRLPLPPSVRSVRFAPTTLTAGQVLNVSMTIQNDSDEALATQDPPPGFVYEEGESFLGKGFVEEFNTVRAGVDFDGRSGVDHPYRWGLGAPLEVGDSVTIHGGIRLRDPQTREYWAGLVREQVAWLVSRQGPQSVTVNPVDNTAEELRRQIAALQAQVQQLQVQVTEVNQDTARLRGTVQQVKQVIQNAGL